MPTTLHSTQIKQDGKGSATVELVISVGEAQAIPHVPHTNSQAANVMDAHAEAVVLKISVKDAHPFLPGFQGDAIERAIEILRSLKQQITEDARKYDN